MIDYIRIGAWEGPDPDPRFDARRYVEEHPQTSNTVRAANSLQVVVLPLPVEPVTTRARPSSAIGDLSASGHNIRNIGLVPTVVRDTQTQQSHGVEFEVTANLTREWRLLANAAYTRAWQSNTFPDSVRYAAAQDTVVRQILADRKRSRWRPRRR